MIKLYNKVYLIRYSYHQFEILKNGIGTFQRILQISQIIWETSNKFVMQFL